MKKKEYIFTSKDRCLQGRILDNHSVRDQENDTYSFHIGIGNNVVGFISLDKEDVKLLKEEGFIKRNKNL